ncbi:hypothetical protein KI387_028632, partial [Taxus chinensis]
GIKLPENIYSRLCSRVPAVEQLVSGFREPFSEFQQLQAFLFTVAYTKFQAIIMLAAGDPSDNDRGYMVTVTALNCSKFTSKQRAMDGSITQSIFL